MNKLEEARESINEIDKEMADLFTRRMKAVGIVAEYKKQRGLQITDSSREEAVVERNSAYITDESLKEYYVKFLRNNFEVSKSYQHRLLDGMRVAYTGVEGAFANIAAKKIFPDATAVSCRDFKSAYDSVVKGTCDVAVLPVENSYNGDVGQVMDLAFFGNLYITGIYDISVVQNLLGVEGATIDDIRTVISHEQALGQCEDYIHEHGFEAVPVVNTAVAAKQVAEKGDKSIAAIASDEAAKIYGLKKLEAHINGSANNTTRFAVFSRVPTERKSDGQFIMLFTVNNEAGSLGKAISVIGDYGYNLRALKSRPSKDLIWSYYFYAEGEGNINSENGENMLEELSECCNQVRIVGSFDREIAL